MSCKFSNETMPRIRGLRFKKFIVVVNHRSWETQIKPLALFAIHSQRCGRKTKKTIPVYPWRNYSIHLLLAINPDWPFPKEKMCWYSFIYSNCRIYPSIRVYPVCFDLKSSIYSFEDLPTQHYLVWSHVLENLQIWYELKWPIAQYWINFK